MLVRTVLGAELDTSARAAGSENESALPHHISWLNTGVTLSLCVHVRMLSPPYRCTTRYVSSIRSGAEPTSGAG